MRAITSALKNMLSRPKANPILIYQMGKVGSSTIYQSLIRARINAPLFHLHLLNNLDAIEEFILKTRQNPAQTLKEINKGRELRNRFLSGEFANLNIITLVRDPVARNVSAFFQNIYEVIPDFDANSEVDEAAIDRLKKSFLNDYDHNAPLEWFDTQLRDVFDFDVFSREFSKTSGYSIYEESRFKLLILRLENLDMCVRPAMKEFLGLKAFQILDSNISQQKRVGNTYKKFINNLILPDAYLDKMYNSKFARHFYTPEEIMLFRKRWIEVQN